MKLDKNYNYAFVFYDIQEKRVNKVFKICKKYLEHHQKSVFRGKISPSQILKLEKELKKVIDEKHDYVSFVLMVNEYNFFEHSLGEHKEDELFI
ncbi:MAG: CRISPR-associated endonuclease Cas2 [Leptotrichiaceae bacterium]|nr:CRISPR-associated endonuclease Cas2 [Leptotrichiaceae bacterium]